MLKSNNTLIINGNNFVLMGEKFNHDKLKSLREQRKLSQEQIADELKINQSTYAKIESGKIKLDVYRLSDIASFYGVPEQYFYTDEPLTSHQIIPKAFKHIQKEIENVNAVLSSIDTVADWFAEGLFKHSRFSNFKDGDTVKLKKTGERATVLETGYSDEFKMFSYKVITESHQQHYVLEVNLERITPIEVKKK